MVQYYTLEQAAQILQTTPDKLKEMSRKGEVRAFQDRGNLRFRSQEIDELARRRGIGSDAALTLGDAAKAGPPSGARKSKLPSPDQTIALEDDEAPIGREPAAAFGRSGPSSSRSRAVPPSGKSPRPSKLSPQRPSKLNPPSKVGRRATQTSGPASPPPKPASDSDVRLVAEGSDLDFQVLPEAPKSGGSKPARPSKLGKGAPPAADSSVLMAYEGDAGDSDAKISPDSGAAESALAGPASRRKGPSDSDIRIEEMPGGKGGDQNLITEEVDLDAEQARAEEAARSRRGGQARPKAGAPNLPTSSPFELTGADIDLDEPAAAAPGPKTPRRTDPAAKGGETDSSSDFELTPVGGGESTPLEGSSGERAALEGTDDEEVGLGELTGGGAAQSGINLQDPADSGISLEQGGSDEIEFELSLDSGATPKPTPAAADSAGSSEFELAIGEDEPAAGEGSAADESSSEFELALDGGEAGAAEGGEESSSEFELSLDESGEPAAVQEGETAEDSDSEFELTLDAEGGLEESGETDALAGEEGEEKDIFETDFEAPALDEEESGSEAVAEDEDTDLETSDFDLALDEEGSEEDAESGSEVVSLEEDEEAGEEIEAETEGDEEGDLDLEIDPTVETEEEEEAVASGAPAAAPPAKWGPLPALLLLPSVIVLFVVGLLCFELAGTMWGYRQPGRTTGFGVVLHPIAKYFDNTLPD